jgi:hypothetical protein
MQKNQVGLKAVSYEDTGLSYILDDQQLKAIGGTTEAKNIYFAIKNPATNKWEAASKLGSTVIDLHPMPAYVTIKAFIDWSKFAPLAAQDGKLEVEIRNTKTQSTLGYNIQVFGSDYELKEQAPVGTKLLPGDQWVFLDDDLVPHILMLNKNDHAPMYMGIENVRNSKEYSDGWGFYAETLEKDHYDLDNVIVATDGLHADIHGQNVNLSKVGIQYPDGYDNSDCRSAEVAFDKLLNPQPKVLYLEQPAGDTTGELAIYDITNRKLLNTMITASEKIVADDPADDSNYASAFSDRKVPTPESALIPHRQYKVNFTFRCKEGMIDVPCGDLLNQAIANPLSKSEILTAKSRTSYKEQLSLNEISTPLKNALIDNKSIENDGNVNLIQNARILNPNDPNTVTVPYRPYFAQSNQNLISLTLKFPGETKPWIGEKFLEPVKEVYNYKFETQEVTGARLIDVDYSSTMDKPSFNLSDEFAGTAFSLANSWFDKTKLQAEGRYGMGNAEDYKFEKKTKYGALSPIIYNIFYLKHPTNLPIPMKIGISSDDSDQPLYSLAAYLTSVTDKDQNYSVTLSKDGTSSERGNRNEIIFTDHNNKSNYYHAVSHWDRDYDGAGASVRIFRN